MISLFFQNSVIDETYARNLVLDGAVTDFSLLLKVRLGVWLSSGLTSGQRQKMLSKI